MHGVGGWGLPMVGHFVPPNQVHQPIPVGEFVNKKRVFTLTKVSNETISSKLQLKIGKSFQKQVCVSPKSGSLRLHGSSAFAVGRHS